MCERDFGTPYYDFHRAELLDVLRTSFPKGYILSTDVWDLLSTTIASRCDFTMGPALTNRC